MDEPLGLAVDRVERALLLLVGRVATEPHRVVVQANLRQRRAQLMGDTPHEVRAHADQLRLSVQLDQREHREHRRQREHAEQHREPRARQAADHQLAGDAGPDRSVDEQVPGGRLGHGGCRRWLERASLGGVQNVAAAGGHPQRDQVAAGPVPGDRSGQQLLLCKHTLEQPYQALAVDLHSLRGVVADPVEQQILLAADRQRGEMGIRRSPRGRVGGDRAGDPRSSGHVGRSTREPGAGHRVGERNLEGIGARDRLAPAALGAPVRSRVKAGLQGGPDTMERDVGVRPRRESAVVTHEPIDRLPVRAMRAMRLERTDARDDHRTDQKAQRKPSRDPGREAVASSRHLRRLHHGSAGLRRQRRLVREVWWSPGDLVAPPEILTPPAHIASDLECNPDGGATSAPLRLPMMHSSALPGGIAARRMIMRPRATTRRTTHLLALVATAVLCGLHLRPAHAEHPPREVWQRADEILYALGATAGARIADLGAGGGFYTTRLSDAAGSGGRVYAIDIDEPVVRELLAKVRDSRLANVDVILGTPTDPRLPFESLDAVLTVNTYHEITERPRTLQAIRQALKPGGRLVIVDNVPPTDPGKEQHQSHVHAIALDTVVRELDKAGFKVTRRDPQFVSLKHDGHEHKEWLLVAVRPL